MSDGQVLFAVLCLIYLSECLFFLRRHSVAFVSAWMRKFKTVVTNNNFGTSNGSIHFLNPLPPFGKAYFTHISPVSISPKGIVAYNLQACSPAGRPDQSGRYIAFAEIKSVSHLGNELFIDKAPFAKFVSSRQAAAFDGLIERLAGMPEDKRESAIKEHIAEQFDQSKAAAALSYADKEIKLLRLICIAYFILFFAAFPVFATVYGLIMIIIPAAVIMFLAGIHICITFRHIHNKLLPESIGDRRMHIAKMALCPPIALRACDSLMSDLIPAVSPILAAKIFDVPPEFIRSYLRDMRYPLAHDLSDKNAIACAEWYLAAQLAKSMEYLEKADKKSYDAALLGPEPEDGAILYCPRCLEQFNKKIDECFDCPGVKLNSFKGNKVA